MNMTLIGMPASGKSFVGRQLAQKLNLVCVDPDKLLESAHKKPLQEFLEEIGDEAFIKIEAELSTSILEGKDGTLLSTGGSIVYSEEAMMRIKELSTIIYLEVPFEILVQRMGTEPRGIVGLKDKTIEQLFIERKALYEKWAGITVNGNQEADLIVTDVLQRLSYV